MSTASYEAGSQTQRGGRFGVVPARGYRPVRDTLDDTATTRRNGKIIASSDDTVIVEGNHYFPLESVDQGVLKPSDHTSVCPWKGTANYYSLQVNGAENMDAAWYCAEPKQAAAQIKGRVAFWKGVEITA